jgi:hypothetical protein
MPPNVRASQIIIASVIIPVIRVIIFMLLPRLLLEAAAVARAVLAISLAN